MAFTLAQRCPRTQQRLPQGSSVQAQIFLITDKQGTRYGPAQSPALDYGIAVQVAKAQS